MKRIFPIAIGATLLAFAGVQSYGFMLASVDIAPSTDLLDAKTLVLSLQEDFENTETSCNDKLVSVESAIEDIDLALDAGTADEENLLEARETLAEMQATLPCAQTLTALGDGEIIDAIFDDEGGLLAGSGNGASSGGLLSGGGGGALGGGSLGGGALGTGAIGSLVGGGSGFGLIAAIAAGVAIPVAVGDGGDDATVTTP